MDSEPRAETDPDEVLSQAFYRDRNVADEGDGPGDSRKTIVGRLLLYLIPIAVLLAGADLLARWALPPYVILPCMQKEMAFYTLKVDRFLENPAPDVLLLGSSRIRDDVNPGVLAELLSARRGQPATVFNFGLGGAFMEEVYTIASSYLPDPPPRYVILGFSGTEVAWPFHFQYASRFLWRFDNFMDYLGRVDFSNFEVRHVEYFIEAGIARYWYLFAHRDAIQNFLSERLTPMGPEKAAIRDAEKRRLVNHVMAEDGYWPYLPRAVNLAARLERDPGSVHVHLRRELMQDPDLLNEESARLIALTVERLRARGCKVAVIETPPSPYLQNRNNVLHGEGFRRWMRGVAEEIDVPFFAFPLNSETRLNNAKYNDVSHLSIEGAKHFTRLVFKALDEAGFFEEDDR